MRALGGKKKANRLRRTRGSRPGPALQKNKGGGGREYSCRMISKEKSSVFKWGGGWGGGGGGGLWRELLGQGDLETFGESRYRDEKRACWYRL